MSFSNYRYMYYTNKLTWTCLLEFHLSSINQFLQPMQPLASTQQSWKFGFIKHVVKQTVHAAITYMICFWHLGTLFFEVGCGLAFMWCTNKFHICNKCTVVIARTCNMFCIKGLHVLCNA